ncbi:MAG: hypothetical protein Q9170_002328 [Blastenia crenularia]
MEEEKTPSGKKESYKANRYFQWTPPLDSLLSRFYYLYLVVLKVPYPELERHLKNIDQVTLFNCPAFYASLAGYFTAGDSSLWLLHGRWVLFLQNKKHEVQNDFIWPKIINTGVIDGGEHSHVNGLSPMTEHTHI